MLYLKSSNAVVVEKSNVGQTGVDAGDLTLHVWCLMLVREATGVSVINTRQTLQADDDDGDDEN